MRSPSPMPRSSTYTPRNGDGNRFQSRNNTPSPQRPPMVKQDTPRFNSDNHYQNQGPPRAQGAQYNRSNNREYQNHREYQNTSQAAGNAGSQSKCRKCDQFCGFVMNEGDITQCKAYNVQCRYCNIKGHYERVCLKKLNQPPPYNERTSQNSVSPSGSANRPPSRGYNQNYNQNYNRNNNQRYPPNQPPPQGNYGRRQ